MRVRFALWSENPFSESQPTPIYKLGELERALGFGLRLRDFYFYSAE